MHGMIADCHARGQAGTSHMLLPGMHYALRTALCTALHCTMYCVVLCF